MDMTSPINGFNSPISAWVEFPSRMHLTDKVIMRAVGMAVVLCAEDTQLTGSWVASSQRTLMFTLAIAWHCSFGALPCFNSFDDNFRSRTGCTTTQGWP